MKKSRYETEAKAAMKLSSLDCGHWRGEGRGGEGRGGEPLTQIHTHTHSTSPSPPHTKLEYSLAFQPFPSRLSGDSGHCGQVSFIFKSQSDYRIRISASRRGSKRQP